jgi:hypothetical protein
MLQQSASGLAHSKTCRRFGQPGHEFSRRACGSQLAQFSFKQLVIAVVHANTSFVSFRSSTKPYR